MSRMQRGLLFAVVLLSAFATTQRTASAQFLSGVRVYRVEIQYYHWRSDRAYWSTFSETTVAWRARLVYAILENARDEGRLHEAVPSGFSSFPIDVRLTSYIRPWPTLNLGDEDDLTVRPVVPDGFHIGP